RSDSSMFRSNSVSGLRPSPPSKVGRQFIEVAHQLTNEADQLLCVFFRDLLHGIEVGADVANEPHFLCPIRERWLKDAFRRESLEAIGEHSLCLSFVDGDRFECAARHDACCAWAVRR